MINEFYFNDQWNIQCDKFAIFSSYSYVEGWSLQKINKGNFQQIILNNYGKENAIVKNKSMNSLIGLTF